MSRRGVFFLLLVGCVHKQAILPLLSCGEIIRKVEEKRCSVSYFDGWGKIRVRNSVNLTAYGEIKIRKKEGLYAYLKGFLGIPLARIVIFRDSSYVYFIKSKKRMDIDTFRIIKRIGIDKITSLITGWINLPSCDNIEVWSNRKGYWIFSPSIDVFIDRGFFVKEVVLKRKSIIKVKFDRYKMVGEGYLPSRIEIEGADGSIGIEYERMEVR